MEGTKEGNIKKTGGIRCIANNQDQMDARRPTMILLAVKNKKVVMTYGRP
jgi:hypothetical protein